MDRSLTKQFKTLSFNWPGTFQLFVALLISVFADCSAQAAACCAGGGAAPSILSGDDAAQVSVSIARGTVIGDAPVDGLPVFRSGDSSEVTQTSLFSGAILLSDLWQVGAGVPIVGHGITRESTSGNHATGIGDIRLNLAYEFLPEWSYSVWRPRGFAFLQLTLPTGTSIYESQTIGAIDAIGKGFNTIGVGSLLTKRWSLWDVYTIPEIHLSFARNFAPDAGTTIQIGPGWGGSVALGVGVSPGPGDFRFGLRLQPIYESSRGNSTDGIEAQMGYQLSWNSTIEATYLLNTAWAFNATYTDQTLMGPAVNTSLSRTFALGLQHRWER